MAREKSRLNQILREAHLSRISRNRILAKYYAERIITLLRKKRGEKVVELYFPEEGQVFSMLRIILSGEGVRVSKTFFYIFTRIIIARRDEEG